MLFMFPLTLIIVPPYLLRIRPTPSVPAVGELAP